MFKNFSEFSQTSPTIFSFNISQNIFHIYLKIFYFCFQNILKLSLCFVRGVLKKLCVTGPFSACGNTVVPKRCAHVTESIPRAHVKFYSNRLKITR